MLNINISTPPSVMEEFKDKFKGLRLSCDLTQEGLSKRSGVSLGSLKRFEKSGQISLGSLLKLSLVLECLDDFKHIGHIKSSEISSMDALLSERETIKKRGTLK